MFVILCIYGSVQESDEAHDFSGVILIAERDPAAVVAVEMWEPALYAGFQAPRSRLRHSRLGNATGRPARHFHSEAEDFAHFHQKQP